MKRRRVNKIVKRSLRTERRGLVHLAGCATCRAANPGFQIIGWGIRPPSCRIPRSMRPTPYHDQRLCERSRLRELIDKIRGMYHSTNALP